MILILIAIYNVPAMCGQKEQPAVSSEIETTSPEANDVVSAGRKKVEETGTIIGKEIEKFGEKASTRVGGWINAKVIDDITWLKLLVCLVLVIIVMLFERILRWVIEKRIVGAVEEERMSWKRLVLRSLTRPLSLFIWVYGIYGAITPLLIHFQQPDGSNMLQLFTQKIADIGGIIAIFWFIVRLVHVMEIQLRRWTEKTESTIDEMLVPIFVKTLRVFIILIAVIVAIQNMTGIKIGPLLASLGIGGLAVALAAKDSIANFFGTLTILFDKPFQVGQRIVIDSFDGIVEEVGFRSTRLRTLEGHLVTIPNEKVVNSNLENIGLRPNIRWLTNITITYDTPPDKVGKAVQIIREILDNHEGMHQDFPPRVYFNGFNDWSLNILVIAWYHPPDYWAYTEWLQRACMEILHRFNDEGIDFAFPSQTVYMANDDKRQMKLQMLKGGFDSKHA